MAENERTAVWLYSLDDEKKARWKCSNCGKIVHRHPHDKLFCSWCGSKMSLER